MTRYLTLEFVLEYVRSSGGTVRDQGLLASALARPQTSLFGEDAYPGLAQKAAAMMHSLAQNQSLIDGNKRLALLCGYAFLQINGARIGASHDEVFDLIDHDIAAGLHDVAVIAERLRVQPRG